MKLGDVVRDRITGLKGVAIARTEWIYGCTRYAVQPQELDDKGLPKEAQWLDEDQLEVMPEAERVSFPVRRAGGPPPGGKETG